MARTKTAKLDLERANRYVRRAFPELNALAQQRGGHVTVAECERIVIAYIDGVHAERRRAKRFVRDIVKCNRALERGGV
jgi:hypothetical protein